jgi:hypothetical protein
VHLGITLAFLLMINSYRFRHRYLAKIMNCHSRQPSMAAICASRALSAMSTGPTPRIIIAWLRTLDADVVRYVGRVFIVVPVLYLAASALAWLSPIAAIIAFVLIPLLYVRPARNTRHLTSLRPLQSNQASL